MATSRADRLKKLFEGDSLPPPPDPNKSHIADTEILSHMQPLQRPPKPKVVHAPRKGTRPLGTDNHQLSSSDDDEYVRAFRKVPSIKLKATIQPTKETSTMSGYRHGKGPKGKVRRETGTDAAGQKDLDREEEEGVPNADQDGHPLIGRFCPLTLVTKFCYKYMDDPNDCVSTQFFASGKIWKRTWDIYYIHPPASLFTKPLLLVPERQVQTLVDEINSAFHMSIKLPRDPFLLAFYQDGTPAPIHIGISQSRDAVQNMEQGVPPPSGEYGVCPSDASPELERFFEHFKAKMERAVAAQKRKGVAMKKARAKHRLASLVTRYEALKRGQRYLGLRPRDCIGGLPVPDSSLPWDEQLKCEREQRIKYGHILRPLDVDQVAPHPFDRDVVFVSVDVEAFERAQNLITEVGISTLDTADIKSLAPGHGGVNWMECIRSRHFRISNHAHLRNTSFCIGDPEKFLFGRSEFVSVNEVGKAVDSCFQPPYSAGFVHDGRFQARDKTSGRNIQIDPIDQQLRNISLESQQSAQRDISSSQLSNESVDLQGPENENENEERDLANEIAVSGIHSPTELTEDVKVAKHCSETDSSRRVSAADMATTEDRQSSEQQSSLRNVILVGHSVDADLQFLSTLGSKVFHEPPAPVHPRTLKIEDPLRQHILETLDTANLYQVWKCETNTSSLAKVLVEVERTGWHLHNGGNDARYTLEAMIGILIRSRQQEDEVSKAVSADGTAGSEGEKQHLEEKLAGTIRRRQEAVEREERENAAIWTHAIGPYGEGVEVLPDPYSQQGGRPDQQQHRQELGTGAIADAPTDHPAQSTVNEAAGPYSWSSCPRASRDGGEPKGFKIPTSKLEKAKSSSKRRKEVSKLQEEGEIDGPCDWGTEGKDGW